MSLLSENYLGLLSMFIPKFGLDTPQALRNYLKSLEDVDVIVSIRDETDKRRKRIQITAKGWFLLHSLGAAVNDQSLPDDSEIVNGSSPEAETSASE